MDIVLVQDAVQSLTKGLIQWMLIVGVIGVLWFILMVVIRAQARANEYRPSEWARKRGKGQ